MTTATAPAETSRAIALTDIQLSTTGSQAERRKHFDKAAIGELAESIKTVGLLSPLVARPATVIEVIESPGGGRWYPAHKKKSIEGHNLIGGGHKSREDAEAEAERLRAEQKVELVAGERRYLAAKQAGLQIVNVSVRQLTDEQVLEIQLVENLQREDLHELAEAEGYEALHALGHSAEEIAEKVGKSKASVYSRMKLLALSKEARKAFYEGKLTASTALYLARIPVEAVQQQALKEITAVSKFNPEPMSAREVAEHIRENYMTQLDSAGFKTDDATLLPAAGTCGACPKRTGNQPQLFEDVKRGDVCTDPVCFKAKRDAHAAREIAKAEELGRTVITGKKAKDIIPHGPHHVTGGYVALSDRNWQDPKNRTNAQLLGKDFEPVLVRDPKTDVLIKVAPQAAVKEALKKAGVRVSTSSGSTQSAADKKRKFETKYRRHLYDLMRPKFPEKLGNDDLRMLAVRFFDEIWNDAQKVLLNIWGWETAHREQMEKTVARNIGEMDDRDVVKFLFDCIFVRELLVASYSNDAPTLLYKTARKLRIDPERVRRELAAAAKEPKAKAAKKKALRKAK